MFMYEKSAVCMQQKLEEQMFTHFRGKIGFGLGNRAGAKFQALRGRGKLIVSQDKVH